jgi:hypothetical protein
MFKNFFTVMILLLFGFLLPNKIEAVTYPVLDTTSHWLIGNYGFTTSNGMYFRDVRKKVWSSSGVQQEKPVFYEISIVGVRKGNLEYLLPTPASLPVIGGSNPFEQYSFNFKNIVPGVGLVTSFTFQDNGKFSVDAIFYGSGFNVADQWSIITRVDYDVVTSGNNTVEFLWNKNSEGGTLSPPQIPDNSALDGDLIFNLPASGQSNYWSTSTHEISLTYPKMNKNMGPGIENLGILRIINPNDPEFGLILWSDSATEIKATLKEYTGGITLNPQASVSSILQATNSATNYPRFAYVGKDQMMYLSMKANQSEYSHLGFKAFQRPNGVRPLHIRVYQHPPSDMRTWRFNPDFQIYTFYNGVRTFRQAIQELVGSNTEVIIDRSGDNGVPYLPYTGYAGIGQSITESALNGLMTNIRTSNLENLREWRVDIFIVNWTMAGEPTTFGTMFDHGSVNTNHISREGSAVFFKTIANQSSDYLERKIILESLKDLGYALNMSPAWGNCPFVGYCWNDPSATNCSQKKCGSVCPNGVTDCHYSPYMCEKECKSGTIMTNTEYNNNRFEFNPLPANGSQFSEVDWYRLAPEAWVKPGRGGMSDVFGPMPQF